VRLAVGDAVVYGSRRAPSGRSPTGA